MSSPLALKHGRTVKRQNANAAQFQDHSRKKPAENTLDKTVPRYTSVSGVTSSTNSVYLRPSFYAKGAISAPQVKAVQSEVGECRQQPNIREYLCDADEAKYVEMRSVTEWNNLKGLRAREVVVSNTVEAASMFKKDGSIPNRTGVLHTDVVTARQSRRGPSAIDPISGYRGRCLGGIESAVEDIHQDHGQDRGKHAGHKGFGRVAACVSSTDRWFYEIQELFMLEPLVGSNVSEKDSETSDAWGLELGHSGQFGTVEDNLSQRFVAPKMQIIFSARGYTLASKVSLDS
ncbi:hypothetical protein B0H14DRAFT_2603686 [Mycena olivaceomarginata]|nr:hypothetical protein B0H14DRAFT_2603686 [Mycena olivaceomarginata]